MCQHGVKAVFHISEPPRINPLFEARILVGYQWAQYTSLVAYCIIVGYQNARLKSGFILEGF